MNRKTIHFTRYAVLAVALVIGGCGENDAGVELGEGAESYLRYCASCHGIDGEGKPPAFPPLTDPDWAGLPGQALALIALYGLQGEIEVSGRTYRGFMPPMAHMSDEDIASAVGYIQTQWGAGEVTLDAAEVAALRATTGRRGPWRGRQALIEAVE